MIIKNARVFTEDGSFVHGDVVVKDGRFDSVLAGKICLKRLKKTKKYVII